MKLTRAYFEGYIEARFGNVHNLKCPHARTVSQNEWEFGKRRGLLLRHWADGTVPADDSLAAELLELRRTMGERV